MAEQQKLTLAQQEALNRERDRQMRLKEEKAPTTKTEMGRLLKKGGAIMRKKLFADGGEVPAEDRVSLSGGLPPISRDKFEAEEDTGPVTGRLYKGRPKRNSDGSISGGLPPISRDKFAKKGFKTGGSVKSSASRRADGIAAKGKTKGRFV